MIQLYCLIYFLPKRMKSNQMRENHWFTATPWENHSVLIIYEKLKMLIGSIRLQDTVGQLLWIHLSWIQLTLWTSTPLLEHNKIVQYLPGGWIKNLHHHLVYHNVKVKLFNGWIPMKQRLDDRIIMDFVTYAFPEWMWGRINRYRLYLQANTVEDMKLFQPKWCKIRWMER